MSFWDGTQWVATKPPPAAVQPSRSKRLAAATLEAALITALTFGLVAGTAFAAKGGNGGHAGGRHGDGSTIALAPMVADLNGNGLPNHGDTIEFTISTTSPTPSVNLVCNQDGIVVLTGWKGYYDGSLDTNRYFGLASGAWQGGAADCTAWLKTPTRKGWSTLASTSFHVDG